VAHPQTPPGQQPVYLFDRASGTYTFVSSSIESLPTQSMSSFMGPGKMLVVTTKGRVYAYYDPQTGRWVPA